MKAIADFINGYLWSPPMIILVLFTGLLYTFGLRFVQVRKIKDMVKLLFKSEGSETGISSFQAFSLALAGRVGTGNIAGVAAAIYAGGPGAVFWMWMLAIVGAGTSFAEASLSQVYKQEIAGEYRGGTAYYIEKGLNSKLWGIIFAIVITFASAVLFTNIQANAITAAMNEAFNIKPVVSGAVVVVLLWLVISGGVKRLGKVAEMVVPVMSIIYVVMAIVIIIANIGKFPAVLSLIFSSAFGTNAIFGGILGSAISNGVKRGIYSSEAGMATSTQSAAAAEVSHPAKQGLVQGFSVYIDTLFVCTATAFMILITDSYNVIGADGSFIVNNIGNVDAGPVFTQIGVSTVFGSVASGFVAIALLFFAFTTLMNAYYNCETNVAYFYREGTPKNVLTGLRIVYCATTFYGATIAAETAWAYADVASGMCTWINIIVLLLLFKIPLKILKDYEEQQSLGLDPVFDPDKLGIKNAGTWDKIKERYNKKQVKVTN